MKSTCLTLQPKVNKGDSSCKWLDEAQPPALRPNINNQMSNAPVRVNTNTPCCLQDFPLFRVTSRRHDASALHPNAIQDSERCEIRAKLGVYSRRMIKGRQPVRDICRRPPSGSRFSWAEVTNRYQMPAASARPMNMKPTRFIVKEQTKI